MTSKDNFPKETKVGVPLKWKDLNRLFKEADYIITHQVDCAIIDYTLMKLIYQLLFL